jgi:hypothetical protein
MKTTLLADRKVKSIFGTTAKFDFENAIRNKILYSGLHEKNGYVKCKPEDIWLIAYRAWFYGITIIGIESNIDQDVPFYDLCIEDYVDEIRNFGEDNPTQWIISALMPVIIKHPDIQFKFYVDIPEINIPVLEKTIEKNLKD